MSKDWLHSYCLVGIGYHAVSTQCSVVNYVFVCRQLGSEDLVAEEL